MHKKINFTVDLSSVKIIITPDGMYLKRTYPRYLVKRLPDETIIDFGGDKDEAVITVNLEFFKKESMHRFFTD